jgi:hypothetical protein
MVCRQLFLIVGAAPSDWKFYQQMDSLLGGRPNSQASQHGIDADTETISNDDADGIRA